MFVLNCRFLTQNLTGVQRYGYELLKEVQKSSESVRYIVPKQPLNSRYWLPDNITLESTGKNDGHLWEQLDLPINLALDSHPLLLNLCNTAPLLYKNQIVTVHDIAYERGDWHSKQFRAFYKIIIPIILKNSRHVITVSEFSKREIIDRYRINENKISVIYNAPFSIGEPKANDYLDVRSPYILSVGSIDPRKNLKRLIKAFLSLNSKSLTLYLVGKYNKNFQTDPELDMMIKANSERIVFLGYVRDDELVAIYRKALCFVYPSLYEGFGLPPIEAMANGCPVITSNIASLPEICGKGALYCDPWCIPDIAEKISGIVNAVVDRTSLILEGKLNVGRYSWERSGQTLLSIMERYT